METEVELKPCPFVLSHRRPEVPSPSIYIRWVSKVNGFEVVCPRCGTKSPSFLDKEKAVECWNARAATTPSPLTEEEAVCPCTDYNPQVCLNGEVDEGQRHCHCECHKIREVQCEMADMGSATTEHSVGRNDDLACGNKQQITRLRLEHELDASGKTNSHLVASPDGEYVKFSDIQELMAVATPISSSHAPTDFHLHNQAENVVYSVFGFPASAVLGRKSPALVEAIFAALKVAHAAVATVPSVEGEAGVIAAVVKECERYLNNLKGRNDDRADGAFVAISRLTNSIRSIVSAAPSTPSSSPDNAAFIYATTLKLALEIIKNESTIASAVAALKVLIDANSPVAPSSSAEIARRIAEKIVDQMRRSKWLEDYADDSYIANAIAPIISAELAATQTETGWQDMDSAPTEIIGIDKGGNIASMVWLDRKDLWVAPDGSYAYEPIAWLPRSVLLPSLPESRKA